MRAQSVYTVTCQCGTALESETTEMQCRKCGAVRVEWPCVTEVSGAGWQQSGERD